MPPEFWIASVSFALGMAWGLWTGAKLWRRKSKGQV